MRSWKLVAFCALVTSLPVGSAQAQLEYGIDTPRIFSIQPRPYKLGHEFDLGFGIMPLDAFYVGFILGASYTYHFTDFWAWEIMRFHYSINIVTSLEGDIKEEFGAELARGGGERTQLFAHSSIVAKPLFGKLVLWNETIIYSETYFTLGIGPFRSTSGDGGSGFFDPSIGFGVGLRFWSGEVLSVRFEVRDYLVFKNLLSSSVDVARDRKEDGVENTLLFFLSAAINFSNESETEARSAGEAP